MKMRTKHTILTRLLPKTGQTTVYKAGDDGTHQAGWWVGKTIANNKTRFITKTLDGDDVVIDLATGLMWAADANEAGWITGTPGTGWVTGLAGVAALDFAGFSSGWRMPNIIELMSIIDYEPDPPEIYSSVFSNAGGAEPWTSTTYPPDDTQAFYFLGGWFRSDIKAAARKTPSVRYGG